MLGLIIAGAMIINLVVAGVAGVALPDAVRKNEDRPCDCIWGFRHHDYRCGWFLCIFESSLGFLALGNIFLF